MVSHMSHFIIVHHLAWYTHISVHVQYYSVLSESCQCILDLYACRQYILKCVVRGLPVHSWIYMQAIHIKAHSFEIMFKNSVVCLSNTKDETTLSLSLLAIAMPLTSNQLYWCRRHLLVPDSHSRQSNLTHELCTTTTFALQTNQYRRAPIKT